MLQKIRRWFKARRDKKHYKVVKEGLLSNPKLLLEKKASFEKVFGANSRVRTLDQWQRLVNLYGLDQVCQTEGMTETEVKKMMTETYDQKLKRRLRKV